MPCLMIAVVECHLGIAVSRKFAKDDFQLLARLTCSCEGGRRCYFGVGEDQREVELA